MEVSSWWSIHVIFKFYSIQMVPHKQLLKCLCFSELCCLEKCLCEKWACGIIQCCLLVLNCCLTALPIYALHMFEVWYLVKAFWISNWGFYLDGKRCSPSANPAGSIVVEGHELHGEDLRLMYQMTEGSSQFEAHSDAQVLHCLFPLFPFLIQGRVPQEIIGKWWGESWLGFVSSGSSAHSKHVWIPELFSALSTIVFYTRGAL